MTFQYRTITHVRVQRPGLVLVPLECFEAYTRFYRRTFYRCNGSSLNRHEIDQAVTDGSVYRLRAPIVIRDDETLYLSPDGKVVRLVSYDQLPVTSPNGGQHDHADASARPLLGSLPGRRG